MILQYITIYLLIFIIVLYTCPFGKDCLLIFIYIFPIDTSNWGVQFATFDYQSFFFNLSNIGGMMIRFATSVLEKMLLGIIWNHRCPKFPLVD